MYQYFVDLQNYFNKCLMNIYSYLFNDIKLKDDIELKTIKMKSDYEEEFYIV